MTTYVAQPTDRVSAAPVGHVEWLGVCESTASRATIYAHSWFLARDALCHMLGCGRHEIDVTPTGSTLPLAATAPKVPMPLRKRKKSKEVKSA